MSFGTKRFLSAAPEIASSAYALSHGSEGDFSQKPKPPSEFCLLMSVSMPESIAPLTSAGSFEFVSFERSCIASSGIIRLLTCSVQPYG